MYNNNNLDTVNVDNTKVSCHICGFICKSLRWHIETFHNMSCKQYKILFPESLIQHNCNKGLTKETSLIVARWAGKVSKTRILKLESGEIKPWNRGLTKETDNRVKINGLHESIVKKEKFSKGELVIWNKGKKAVTNSSVRLGHAKRCKTMQDNDLFKIAANKTAIVRKIANNYNSPFKGLTKETSLLLYNTGRKVSTTLKKLHREGILSSPIKGKTKEDNLSIAAGAIKCSETRKRLFREGKLKVSQSINRGYGKGGFREDLQHYVRSMFEANFCRILIHNKVGYKYERDTFTLRNGSTYTPDLFLPKQNIYIELKGRLFEKDKLKIELFKEQYSNLKLIVIYQHSYKWKRLNIMYRNRLTNWET